jgi:Cation transporting ATPase, C-terminus
VARPVDADVRQLLVAAGLCNDARILPPNALVSHWTIMRWGRNRLVWVGIATELLLLSLLYVPVLQRLFDTAPFPPQNWLFLCVWVPLLLMADEGRKALVRRRARVT